MSYGCLISSEEREAIGKRDSERLGRLDGGLPDILKREGRFCLCDDTPENGRTVKKPINPLTHKCITGRNCTDPDAYCSYAEILEASRREHKDVAVGLVNGLAAIELDQCYGDDGKMSEEADAIVRIMDCYHELTPGGSGIRILFKVPPGFSVDESLFGTSNPAIGLEVYVEGHTDKCATVTGETLTPGRGIEERGSQLREVMEAYLGKKGDAPKPLQVFAPLPPLPAPACRPLALTLGRTADQLVAHTGKGDMKLSGLGLGKPWGMYKLDHIGMSKLWADTYKDVARHVPERGRWYLYGGKRWAEDKGNVMELVKEFTAALDGYAHSVWPPAGADEAELKRAAGFCKFTGKMQGRAFREAVIKDAASVYQTGMGEFDADPYLLNCLNGTLDLRTADFRPHNPDDLLSMMANVNYDPSASCRIWESHIEAVTEGDGELARYIQKVSGYSLTGDTRQECMFIYYGPSSRNGKSTTLDTLEHMLGSYACSADPATLAQTKPLNASGQSSDIARLAGRRLVVMPEPEGGMMLGNALVKRLTGGDAVVARNLYEHPFEYKPQFKIVMNTNHLPRVTDMTLFRSGRMKVVPFNHRFTGSGQDRDIKWELLKPENLSGILNWCIEGLRLLMDEGFYEPEAVKASVGEYERDSDKTGRFIEDYMAPDSGRETPTDDAYRAYQEWCRRNGHCPGSQTSFKQSLEAHNMEVRRKRPKDRGMGANARTLILGYRLRPLPAETGRMGCPPGGF